MDDLNAATLDDVQDLVPDLLRPEQRDARARRRHRPRDRARSKVRALLRRHPAGPAARRARALDSGCGAGEPHRDAGPRAAGAHLQGLARTRMAQRRYAAARARRRRAHVAARPRGCISGSSTTTRSRPTSGRTRSTARSREATSFTRRRPRAKTSRQSKRAVDEEMARFLRDGPTRTELERVRAELKGSFVRGDRAGRRVPRQVEHPRRERGVRRPPRFLQALARRDERRDARAGTRDRAPLAHGQCARARSPPVPDDARRRQRTVRIGPRSPSLRASPTPPFPALAQATLANGTAPHRRRAPRGAGRAAEPAGRLGLRGRSVRSAGHRKPRDGDARRGHDDARAR